MPASDTPWLGGLSLAEREAQPVAEWTPKAEVSVAATSTEPGSAFDGSGQLANIPPVQLSAPGLRRRPVWVTETEFPRCSVGLQTVLVLISVIAAYAIMLYVLLPENTFQFFPFMYDDYIALSSTLTQDFLLYTRPVHHLLEKIATIWGMSSYYIALNALTVVNVWLVLLFIFRLNHRSIPVIWSFFYAIVVFSSTTYIWAGKYNLFSNHGSMFFGILAMFAILEGFERRTFLSSCIGLIFFAASIFAKEDYFLPVLCIGFYCLMQGGATDWKRNSLVLTGISSIFIIFLLHTLFVVPFSHVMFDVDEDHVYAQDFSISSMAETLQTYLVSYSTPTPVLSIAFAVSLVYALLVARKPRYFLLVAIIFSLFAPYVVLPNHVTEYNAINWIPWMVAFVLVLLPTHLPLPRALLGRRRLIGALGVSLAIGLVTVSTVALTQQPRESEVRFFVRQSAVNQNILSSLNAYRPQLDSVDAVAIVGVEGWSPWLKTQAEFLADRGFRNRWVVFVQQDPFYSNQLAFDPYQQPDPELEPTQSVSFRRLVDLDRYPDLPVLRFDKKGRVVAWGIDAQDYFAQCIVVTSTETTDVCEKERDFKIKKSDTTSAVPNDG